VLGALLGVREQLLGQATVDFGVGVARPGAGDRPGGHDSGRLAHQHLRRGAGERDVGGFEQNHVGAGVDQAQGAVELQRRAPERHPEAARQDHLEDVTGRDVLLRPSHGGAKRFAVEARNGRRRARRLARQGGRAARRRGVEDPGELVERRLGVRGGRLALDFVRDPQQPLARVIEGQHAIEAAEDRQRQPVAVWRPRRQALEQAHQVVTEPADEAARERRRAPRRRDRSDRRSQRRQRVAGQAVDGAVPVALEAIGVEPVDLARPGAEKAVARDLLAAGHALEQEAVRRDLGQAPVHRQRRDRVRQELADMGDGAARLAHRPPPSSRPRVRAAISSGSSRPVIRRNCNAACHSSTSRPSIAVKPRARAAKTSGVGCWP
jgi:hypothetical protein